MKLAKLSEFRQMMYTPKSAPSIKTLRSRIDAGKLPGGLIDSGHYYVDLDEYSRATNLQKNLEARRQDLEKKLTGLV